MSKVFICYRRSDAPDAVDRITERLKALLPENELFKDIHSIPAGGDFRSHIASALKDCRLLLAIIGPTWIYATNKLGNRRIDDPNDYVRIELETALRDNVTIIPITVGGAEMPTVDDLPNSLQPLSFKLALNVRRDPDFENDFARLKAVVVLKTGRHRSVNRIVFAAFIILAPILAVLGYSYLYPVPARPPNIDPSLRCDNPIPYTDFTKQPPETKMICD